MRADCWEAQVAQLPPYFARTVEEWLPSGVSSTSPSPLYLQVTDWSGATNCQPTAVVWRDQAVFVDVTTVIWSAWVALCTGEPESTTFSVKL